MVTVEQHQSNIYMEREDRLETQAQILWLTKKCLATVQMISYRLTPDLAQDLLDTVQALQPLCEELVTLLRSNQGLGPADEVTQTNQRAQRIKQAEVMLAHAILGTEENNGEH